MRVGVVGAGWAGLACAVRALQAGHLVTLLEAARTPGGRARTLPVALPDGTSTLLDNGQHILIGAYSHTLALMQDVGVPLRQVLHAMPLALRFADGGGLALPAWPAPLDAAWGIATARGWGWRDKLSLLRAAAGWQLRGFSCAPDATVAQLCAGLTSRVRAELVDPLCVSALNTPADAASGAVFLRVLRDSLFGAGWGGWGGSWLLLPAAPLGALLPDAALAWLQARGALVRQGARVQGLAPVATGGWALDGEPFDAVVLACPAWEAARLVRAAGAGQATLAAWLAAAEGLRHSAIATVYATGGPRLPRPMLALRSGPRAPAQVVFDRGQLGGAAGLLAFVVSDARDDLQATEDQVIAQAHALGWRGVRPLRTVVDKRATFACVPGLARPGIAVLPGLWACGDWVDGPYPATLEGAVRAGGAVAGRLG